MKPWNGKNMKIGESNIQLRAWLTSFTERIVKKWKGGKIAPHNHDGSILPKNQYTIFKKLGKGYWGTVSQFFTGKEGRIKVVKQINKKDFSDKEVKILEILWAHDHCVSLEKYWCDDKNQCIAMEDAGLDIGRLVYRKNGGVGIYKKGNPVAALFKWDNGFTGIDETNDEALLFKSIFFQSLKGLGYIHEKKLVHRDIKPSNIMITSLGQVRICDFGCATEVGQLSRFSGDVRYMPPEASKFRKQIYTEKSDIWMLGVTMTEMVLGKDAIMSFFRMLPRSAEAVYRKIDKAESAGRISKATGEILKSMLQTSPADRPSAEELLSNKYFQEDLEKLNKLQEAWRKDL